MSQQCLSQRALNRALLARQLLLERSHLPLTDALSQVGGLQTQYAPSGYIGLWTRLAGFARQSLTDALEQRQVVQATVLRATIHMVSAADYWPMTEGVRQKRRRWWLRMHNKEMQGIDMAEAAALVRQALAEGPRRRAELAKVLEAAGFASFVWQGVGFWVDMVRVPPSGTWERRRADLYALAEHCLEPVMVTEEEGVRHLVQQYLGGFGPATHNDIAGWAGLPVKAVRAATATLDLHTFRDDAGKVLVDLPGAPLPDPDTPAPVRFLPTWEATLLAHARRTQILPEQYRTRVFHVRMPHSVNTFLVDGAVAGTWREDEGRIVLDPFHDLPRLIRRELDEEAQRLAVFHAG